MRVRDTAGIAFEALRRAPLRAAMMLLATAIGVAAVVLLTSLGEGARLYIGGQFSALGTNLLIVLPGKSETTGAGMIAATTTRDLTLDDAEAISRNPRVARMAPVSIGQAAVSFGGRERDVSIIGTNSQMLPIRHWTLSMGSFLPELELSRSSPVCVLGREIRAGLFDNANPLGQWIRLGDQRCRVIGVLGDTGTAGGWNVDDLVVIPVASAQALFNNPSLFRILAELTSRDATLPAKNDIIQLMKLRHRGEEDVTVMSQDAILSTFDSIFQAVNLALAGIAAISLVVAGVLIMNVMLVAVSQRTREIGLYKALGARRRQIVTLFMVEAATLALLGALLGLLVGALGVLGLRTAFPDLGFAPPVWAVAAALITAVASGLVFGILPARRAAALDPVIALAGK
jgi:putative ABC transport system permease protein